MTDPFSAAVATLPTLDLESMNLQAALQVRHDRKYIVPAPVATDLVLWAGTGRAGVGQAMALEVAGTTESPYDSTYYDTPALEAYRMAARRHRHRFKVRTRRYPDTGDRFLEVKTKSASGQTVKHRVPWGLEDGTLGGEGLSFVAERLGRTVGGPLRPVLHTFYRRTTLLLPGLGTRLTLDRDLLWTPAFADQPSDHSADVGGALRLSRRLVVETKSAGHPTAADRWLWRRGIRPVAVSKYCAGQALLHPDLPHHRWHRTLHRDLPVAPAAPNEPLTADAHHTDLDRKGLRP
ncbi:polyphosphate polymerase domain-containing protein [Citricoccus muralis]|uniref:VTC domain-containing protein n=1 Tax=Citricoccus muralis TaxID=169134 RepID=A0A3D9LDG6_9MICC|nr:polyphosphate polymerase domain-containing protein [Citricoccus muralis]REE04469.1 VTC domain-containing protein [Citricoccus muralis]